MRNQITKCKLHPKYKAQNSPTCACCDCWRLWLQKSPTPLTEIEKWWSVFLPPIDSMRKPAAGLRKQIKENE